MEIRKGYELRLFGESGYVIEDVIQSINLPAMLSGEKETGVDPLMTMMNDVGSCQCQISLTSPIIQHTIWFLPMEVLLHVLCKFLQSANTLNKSYSVDRE